MISVQTSGEESREENRDVKYPPDIINLVVDGVVKRGIIVAINPMKILSRSIRRAFNPTCVQSDVRSIRRASCVLKSSW